MIALFTLAFAASVIFLILLLLNLKEDLERKSIRPFYFLLLAIAFWVLTFPAYLALPAPSSINIPQETIVTSSGNTIISGYTATISQLALPPAAIYTYLILYVPIFFLYILFGILIYYEGMIRMIQRLLGLFSKGRY